MNIYHVKNEEYLECLKKNRKAENTNQNNSGVPQVPEEQGEDNTIEMTLRKLRLHEFERDLANLRGLISNIAIPRLLKIEPSTVSLLLKLSIKILFLKMKDRMKEIVQSLIDITIYSFSKCYACFSDPNHPQCPKIIDIYVENTDNNIRILLNKYFDYCIAKMNSK